MANELQYYGNPETETGLTVVARVYDAAGAQVSTDVTTTEVGVLAIYQGDMPTAAAGQYGVRFFNGTTLLGQGCIDWDGTAEVTGATLNADIDAAATTATANAAAIAGLNNLSAADVQAELITYDAAVPADLAALATAASIAALNDLSAADVAAELATYDAATGAEVAALNNLSAADVNAQVDIALADYDPPTKAELDTLEANVLAGQGGAGLTIPDVQTALTNQGYTAARAPNLDNVDVATSTRLATAGYTAPDNAGIGANGTAIAALNDLSAAEVQAELVAYDATTAADLAGLATAASVASIPTNPLLANDARLDNLDATVSSRLATVGYTAPDNAGISANGSAISSLNDLDSAAITAASTAALTAYDPPTKAELDTLEAAIPTAAVIADAVLDETLADHLTAGSAGEALNTAGSGGVSITDIQLALTNQGYTTARAPNLDNLDTTVSSRLSTVGYTAPDNANIAANAAAIASLNDISAVDVWAAATRTLTDTTGFELTAGERTAIATAVEQSILNEGDGQQVLNAIVGAIGNTNVDEVALVAAIRSDLERAGGAIDLLETESAAAVRHTALVAEHDATQLTLAGLNDLDATAAQAAATAALTAYDPATGTELSASEAVILAGQATSGVTVADIVTGVWTEDLDGYATGAGADLHRIRDLEEADETLAPTFLEKRHKDTAAVILRKNVTGVTTTQTIVLDEDN